LIVGIFLAKVTMATIVYCMGKRTKALLPSGTEDLKISFDPLDRLRELWCGLMMSFNGTSMRYIK
jgi:hypothetical protein